MTSVTVVLFLWRVTKKCSAEHNGHIVLQNIICDIHDSFDNKWENSKIPSFAEDCKYWWLS